MHHPLLAMGTNMCLKEAQDQEHPVITSLPNMIQLHPMRHGLFAPTIPSLSVPRFKADFAAALGASS